MQQSTDEKSLVKGVAVGDEDSFRKLFDLYRDKLFAFSLKFTKSREHAEEIVQEVFIKIWENRSRLNPDLSFQAYIYRITQNHTFDFLKKAAQDRSFKKILVIWVETLDTRVEDELTLAGYEEVVHRAIDLLPPQQQMIFRMSRDQYLSHEEIAQQLSISKNTVKVHMVRATKFIRSYLQQHADITLACLLFLMSKW